MTQPPSEEKTDQPQPNELKPEITARPASPVQRRGHKILFILILLSLSLLFGGMALEVVLRIFCPWLMPQKREFTKDLGLPRQALEAKWYNMKTQPHDLIAIGDSYVETGSIPVGWITQLAKFSGRKIAEIGFQGATPTQYFGLYDRLRAEGVTTPVVIVIWIGNDFVDESIYAALGQDKSAYFDTRYKLLSNSKSPFFWPGCDLPPWSWMSDHLASYRAGVLTMFKFKEKLRGPQPDPTDSLNWNEGEVRRLANERCNKQPWAEWVGDRLYLFLEHQALVDPDAAAVKQGKQRILDLLKSHATDPNLIIAPCLDQEEIAEAVHGRKIHHAAPFIDEIRKTGVRMLDCNPAFRKAAKEKALYYGDGHWNADGHAVIAQAVKEYLKW